MNSLLHAGNCSTNYGGGVAATSIARQPQVESELDALGKAIADLENAVGSAANRLAAILDVAPSNDNKPPGTPQLALVPLAENIREGRQNIERITAMLHEISRRIEL